MLRTDRLIALRKERNLVQQELADYLKVTRPAYVRYEKGNNQPPNDALSKLADFFDVSVDYLLGKTDDPTPPDKKKAPSTFEEVEKAYLDMLLKKKGTSLEELVLTEEDKEQLRSAFQALIKGYGK